MPKPIYYCDMDGVIVDFFAVANWRDRYKTEMDFFKMLSPIAENLNALKVLIARGEKVRILSKAPNDRADYCKRVWLARYLPELKAKHIIITRPNKDKIDYIPKFLRKRAVLIDDYGVNVRAWVAKGGGNGIKILGKNRRRDDVNYMQFETLMDFAKLI